MSAFPKYDRYKDSGVEWLGEIPEHWEAMRVFSAFNERVERGNDELPILNISIKNGVQEDRPEGDREQRTIEDRTAYKRAAAGDIAYNTMRMWQGAVGDVPVDGLISPAYVVARPIKDINTRYYSYLFRGEHFQVETNRHSYGIVSDRNRLYWLGFKNIVIPIPPKPEQDRIVTFLDRKTAEIDALINKKQRQIELLDEQKAIHINRAVTRGLKPKAKLKPSGIEWIGDIPVGWSVKRLGHVGRVGNGSTPARSNQGYWNQPDFPWLNSASVNQDFVTKTDQFVSSLALRECHLPRLGVGTVIIAITGQGKTRGTAALMKVEATINQHIAYVSIQNDDVLPEFVHLSLKSQYNQLRSISESGSTKGALTCQDIKEFKIAVPPRSEQEDLVSQAEKLRLMFGEAVDKANNQIQSLKTLRSTLIAHAVTGKIAIHNPTG